MNGVFRQAGKIPCMVQRAQLLKLLGDGRFHSGTDIGLALGVSRAAISKAVQGLVRRGFQVHRVSGRGYRLTETVQPLDADTIRMTLRATLPTLRIVESVRSTNSELSASVDNATPLPAALLAEAQSAGRGRRGRGWISTAYRNLILSLAWRFGCGPAGLAGLSLGVGVALVRALRELGVGDAALKWPNDVLWRRRKLAGVLIDVRGELGGPSLVVIGVGLNVSISERDGRSIDQPWVDLREVLGTAPDRNRVAAAVLTHLLTVLATFETHGFAPLREAWLGMHAFQDARVRAHADGRADVEGRAVGLDEHGALLIQDEAGRLHRVEAGDVSLRVTA